MAEQQLNLHLNYWVARFLAGYADGQIRFFAAATARFQTHCNLAQLHSQDPSSVNCIKFRPYFPNDLQLDEEFRTKNGGKTLLAVTCDGHITHWNALTGKL